MGRMHLRRHRAGSLVAMAALATVVGLATPAAAADSSTTVQASPSTVDVGDPVTLTATVTCAEDPSPGLGVTFFDGPDTLSTVEVSPSGQAALTETFDVIGTHTITAAYNGNGGCGASNTTTTVTVTEAPTPPTPPRPSPCILLCDGLGLISFHTGDIHNEINIHSNNGRGHDDARWPLYQSNHGGPRTHTGK